jgi:hypothetical protein
MPIGDRAFGAGVGAADDPTGAVADDDAESGLGSAETHALAKIAAITTVPRRDERSFQARTSQG